MARVALARGCAVTAVDASAGMVARLAADYPEITAHQRDAGALEFADDSFDVVTAGFLVQVLTEPAAGLAEFRWVLVPGGMMALSLERQTVGRLGWLYDLNREFFGGGSSSPLTADQLDKLLVDAGLTALARVEIDIPKPLPSPTALWDEFARMGIDEALGTLPANRAAAYRERFLAGAEEMHESGGIVLEFGATLHRATVP